LIIKFICEDNYEAEKLTSIFSLQNDNSLFASQVVKIIGNEAIVNLKDGSHHSILFKDRYNAANLEKMFNEISAAKSKIVSTYHVNNEVFFNLN
jgi:hypothetical protein